MNCRDIESLLLAERDGVLPAERHADFAKHIAACPACRHRREAYGEAVTFLKTDAANVAVPDVDKEWREVRARLGANATESKKTRRLAPIIWFAAPLAAAAALAFAYLGYGPRGSSRDQLTAASAEAAAQTIAYVDKDSGWLVVWADDAKTSG
jgi:anti-sigma factor RsiW